MSMTRWIKVKKKHPYGYSKVYYKDTWVDFNEWFNPPKKGISKDAAWALLRSRFRLETHEGTEQPAV